MDHSLTQGCGSVADSSVSKRLYPLVDLEDVSERKEMDSSVLEPDSSSIERQIFKVSAVHVEAGLSTPWNGCHQCRSIAETTEIQAACRRATKSICVITTSEYTSSLRWFHRKKSNGVRSGERGGYRIRP
ncbi:uncharacterized protein TNCV_2385651 [Trichonephila clavipes]|nr:uncharacterized protein TNCV_2385651 [Trichonephila clavipes]